MNCHRIDTSHRVGRYILLGAYCPPLCKPMRTQDLDEAVDAVTRVYCAHRIQVTGQASTVDVALDVVQPATQPLIQLSYGTSVRIDTAPQAYLMMYSTKGAARTRQGNLQAEWKQGQTLPFSAGIDTELWFDEAFVHRGMRIDAQRLENLCARWLGHPLTRPLRFRLQPFSHEFEHVWQRTLAYVASFADKGLPFRGASKAAFDEYLLTLLLHQHPHNFSDELAEHVPAPIPGVVRRAERYMLEHADAPITVSDVAEALGVSLRSLQQGFREWRSTTPLIYLRQVRLQRVRDELLRKDSEATVTEIAVRYGFAHLGRFSAYYKTMFGEAPSVTWRRTNGFRRMK